MRKAKGRNVAHQHLLIQGLGGPPEGRPPSMQQTAIWNFAPGSLPELLNSFGCADVIAPVDDATFGRRAGELICRKKAQTPRAAAGKYRLRALQCFETAAQTRDHYAKDMLTVAAREFLQAACQAEEKRQDLTHQPSAVAH
jgi:hypothetical protein